MKHKKLAVLGALAAAATLTVAATAMAAPSADTDQAASPTIEAEIAASNSVETVCEIDSETGEVRIDGSAVTTIDASKLEGADAVTVTMQGEDGEVVVTPGAPDGLAYEITDSGVGEDGPWARFEWTDQAD